MTVTELEQILDIGKTKVRVFNEMYESKLRACRRAIHAQFGGDDPPKNTAFNNETEKAVRELGGWLLQNNLVGREELPE